MTPIKILEQSDLEKLFTHQLNRISCTKGYLIRNLPPLAGIASFKNMKLAIEEAHSDVQKQTARVEEIYNLLNSEPSDEGCEVIKAVMEEAYHFGNHTGKSKVMNDMDIILYMSLVQNIELTSFRMLRLINQFMGNDKITQLLAECCDENIDNDSLFMMVSEEYLAKKVQA